MKGRFIVLEGIDGSGTTTQLPRIVDHLKSRGRKAVVTREPSTGPVGRLIREMLLGKHKTDSGNPVDGRTMALLFAADRQDHLHREVYPALEAGVDVVCDRFLLSSLAYQVEEKAKTEWLLELAQEVPYPDLTILFDLDIAIAAKRRMAAGRPFERYDADSNLAKVAKNYRELIAMYPGGVTIDASVGIDAVSLTLCDIIDGRWFREQVA
jgi:dTMP kinase